MKTNRFPRAIPLAALALLLAGCPQLSRQVNTANITGTTTRVLDRHDAYVNADATLAADVRAKDLSQSAFLRDELKKPAVPASELAAALNPVCDRTDVYDNANAALPPYKLRSNLRDTQILREVLSAGRATPAAP